jgi:hypothetical protein
MNSLCVQHGGERGKNFEREMNLGEAEKLVDWLIEKIALSREDVNARGTGSHE